MIDYPMPTSLIDFHCHLDLYENHVEAILSSERYRILTLSVTTTPKAWRRNHELTKNTSYVRAALGLHPQLVVERKDELCLWEKYLPEAFYIGEVGLDAGPRFLNSLPQQIDVFEHILRCCAEVGSRILSVHSVRSASKVLDLIEKNLAADRGKVVLHWFSGSISEAKRAINLGCYFSVNLEMLRTNKGRVLIEQLPHDRLLTETDGPFTQIGKRSAMPFDTVHAVDILAKMKSLDRLEMAKLLFGNLESLLKGVSAPKFDITDGYFRDCH